MGKITRNRSSRLLVGGPARRSIRASSANEALTNQTDRLYEEAQRDPRSDAGCMVRAFVLSGIRSSETCPYDEGASSAAMGRERQRQARASRRASEAFRAEARRARAKTDELEQQMREQEAALGEIAERARKAALGEDMDPNWVYERIARIVGLRSPLKPLGPQQPEVREPSDDRPSEPLRD